MCDAYKPIPVESPISKRRMTNFDVIEVQFVMLFSERRHPLSCYFSSSIANPKQAYSRPHFPSLQERHFMPWCHLCMINYLNSYDFNPDTPITLLPDWKRWARWKSSCPSPARIECKYVWVWNLATCDAKCGSCKNLCCMNGKRYSIPAMQRANFSCGIGIKKLL